MNSCMPTASPENSAPEYEYQAIGSSVISNIVKSGLNHIFNRFPAFSCSLVSLQRLSSLDLCGWSQIWCSRWS